MTLYFLFQHGRLSTHIPEGRDQKSGLGVSFLIIRDEVQLPKPPGVKPTASESYVSQRYYLFCK